MKIAVLAHSLWLSQRQYLNGACLVNRLCHNPKNRQGAVALPTATAAKLPRRSCFCTFATMQLMKRWMLSDW